MIRHPLKYIVFTTATVFAHSNRGSIKSLKNYNSANTQVLLDKEQGCSLLHPQPEFSRMLWIGA